MSDPSVAEMIAQARSWPRDGVGEGRWFHAMADKIERLEALAEDWKVQAEAYRKECNNLHGQIDHLRKRITAEVDDGIRLNREIEMAREAIEAHGNTELIRAWYRKWKPDYFARSGIPTTAQYSLSCFLMQHAADLLRAEKGPAQAAGRTDMPDVLGCAKPWSPWCSPLDKTPLMLGEPETPK